jgi:putative ABC transport system permease protein
VGLLVAHWGGTALRAGLLDQSAAPAGLRDPRTVGFALMAAVAVGLLTGLAPVFQSRRADLVADLKAGAREGTYARSRLRAALLVLQGALSVVLLCGAGLFVRSLRNVEGIRLGYDVDPVLYVSRNMRGVQLDSAREQQLVDRLLETAKTIPGVASASRQTGVPFWSNSSTSLFVEGIDTVSRLGQFDYNVVTPDYFKTMGTRIIRGRGISDADNRDAPKVMVASEAMGRVLWPGRDAILQCVRVSADTMPCTTVVGIAENIKEQSLRADSGYYYYIPAAQFARARWGGLFLRMRGDAAGFKESVRRALQREMPGTSYVTVTPFAEIVGPQMRSWHLGATMFVAFGALALVLAAIGLYSVIAYNVSQRTHELGVRMALGAQASDLARLVVQQGLGVAALGVGIGVVVALWASKWIEPLLFQVSPRDATIYSVVSVVLLLVAVGASWIPARRAARVNPNIALRAD